MWNPWRQGHDREPNLLSDRGGLHLLVHYRVLPQAGRFFSLISHLLSHCTSAIADTYSSNTKTRCPWEAEVLEGPSQYCRHPGYPTLLPIIGIHRGGQKLILPHLSLLDTFWQESLFPLEVTEQPFEVEVTTTSSSVLAGEEDEEGTNFDEMSRIIQVSSYFHLTDCSSCWVSILGKWQQSVFFLQVFRIARIMRIFKLARSSTGLQVNTFTQYSSVSQFERGVFLDQRQ